MLSEAFFDDPEENLDSEAWEPHPISRRRFHSPTGNTGIQEISSALQSRPGTAASACQSPLSEVSAYQSRTPAEKDPEVFELYSGGASVRTLPEHGLGLVASTLTLDVDSFITEIEYIAEET